jgi:hypothetical protein
LEERARESIVILEPMLVEDVIASDGVLVPSGHPAASVQGMVMVVLRCEDAQNLLCRSFQIIFLGLIVLSRTFGAAVCIQKNVKKKVSCP